MVDFLSPEVTAPSSSSSLLNNSTLPRASKKRNQKQSFIGQQQSTNSHQHHQQQLPQRSFIRACNRAKRVRFFRNGDQYFKGIWYAVSYDRFRCFEALLEDLNRTIGDLVNLPHGVRYVFTTDGQKRVTCLEQLTDGESYVCSSNEIFKRIDYENAREPVWNYSTPKHNRTADRLNSLSVIQDYSTQFPNNDFIYPKIITIIRNGVKPRRVVRLLLNKRTARSFEQVLSDVTVLVKLDTGAVRKLFSLNGTQLLRLSDLFNEEDVFIACGNERMSIDDFYLDSEEYRFLYSSRYRTPAKNGGIVGLSKTPLSARGPNLNAKPKIRFNYASPEMRRKFLNQKNRRKFNPNQDKIKNETNKSGSVDSCLTAPSYSPVYPLEMEDRFKIGRIIGDGNFAVVHECICRETKEFLALKVIEKAKCAGKLEMVENEVGIMRQLRHSHIVQLIDYFNLDEYFFLVIEFVNGGDLFDSLISVRYYSEREASLLMNNLLSALEYLHDKQIVHRDVKPENLLIYELSDGRKQLKLADFGLATYGDVMLYTICGTPTYVAPEILRESGYGLKVDIWAAGVILYIMLCGFPPFVSLSNDQEELFEMILSGEYNFPRPYWCQVSATAKTLIQAMLQSDVDRRLTAAGGLSHIWITGEGAVDNDLEEIYKAIDADAQYSNFDSVGQNNTMLKRKSNDLDSNYEFYYSRRRSMDELSTVTNDLSEHWTYCNGDGRRKTEDDDNDDDNENLSNKKMPTAQPNN